MKNFIKKIGMLGIFICTCGHIQAMQYNECRFWKAMNNKNTTVAKNLAAAGHIDVNFRNDKGGLAIGCVAYCNAIDVAEALFYSGHLLINGQAKVSGRAAIHIAAFCGHLEMVKWLVEHGADVNILDKCTEPPLYYADMDESGEITKYLITHGADESKKKGDVRRLGSKPMHRAIHFDDVITLRSMLEAGADPNFAEKFNLDSTARNIYNLARSFGTEGVVRAESVKRIISILSGTLTALQYAVTLGKPTCAHLLLEHGARIDYDVFHRAKLTQRFDITPMLFRFAGKQADHPLLYAIEFGDISSVHKMLENGIDPNIAGEIDGHIRTPLSLAAGYNASGIVALLLEYGAKPHCRIMPTDNGPSPLVAAINSGGISSLRILLRATMGRLAVPQFTDYLFYTASISPSGDALATLHEFYPYRDFSVFTFREMPIAMASTTSLFFNVTRGGINEARFFSYIECINFLLRNGAGIHRSTEEGISANIVIQYIIDALEDDGTHQNWIRALRAIPGFMPRPRVIMNRSSSKTENDMAM